MDPRQLWSLIFDISDLLRDGALAEQTGAAEFLSELTVRQHKTIKAVSILTEEKPEGVTLKEVAEYLNLAPCTVSETVESLVKTQTLERRPNPQDRRAVCISLSENGKRAKAAGIRYLNNQAESVLSQLSDSDRQQFIRMLEFYKKTAQRKV